MAKIRQELKDHFGEMNQNEIYGKKMLTFLSDATEKVDDLIDDVNHAGSTFSEVVKYYGEDEKNMSSSEFFGIFKTFLTSYQVSL
jgi:cytokinesis protein